MTLKLEDIITCKSYIPLCNYRYDAPNLDDIPPSGLVHVPMDQIHEFFKRIEGNGHRYVVVSSCSDYSVAYQQEHPVWKDMLKWAEMQVGPGIGYNGIQFPPRCNPQLCNPRHKYSIKCHSWTKATFADIPDNVHRWFVVGSWIADHPKIEHIPFGIAEGKAETLFESALKNVDYKLWPSKRKKSLYISWQDYTYERYRLRKEIEQYSGIKNLNVTIRQPNEPEKYEDYLKSLSEHYVVIAPPGNGLDSYRVLEALYLGACVLTSNQLFTQLDLNLMLYCHRNLSETMHMLRYKNYGQGLRTGDKIKLSYYRTQFEKARDEILCGV